MYLALKEAERLEAIREFFRRYHHLISPWMYGARLRPMKAFAPTDSCN